MRSAERQERLVLELANGCTVEALEEPWGAPREERALGADVGPNRLELVDHLQRAIEGSIVAQVTQG
jgi:hypothetical protein